MNIFHLSNDIKQCARYHTDKHVVKMILESTQLLSTIVRMSGIDAGYKVTHENHPSTRWTRQSLSNWLWLRDLVSALHDEWRYRFNHPDTKFHKSYRVAMALPEPNIPDIGMTPFAQAMPNVYKHKNPITAYRDYYNGDKRHLFKWTKRKVPPFVRDYDYFEAYRPGLYEEDNDFEFEWDPRRL